MSKLKRRVERLEEMLTPIDEPRFIIITINPDNVPESPYHVMISAQKGLWAIAARGGPFTDEEIKQLREEHEGSHE